MNIKCKSCLKRKTAQLLTILKRTAYYGKSPEKVRDRKHRRRSCYMAKELPLSREKTRRRRLITCVKNKKNKKTKKERKKEKKGDALTMRDGHSQENV